MPTRMECLGLRVKIRGGRGTSRTSLSKKNEVYKIDYDGIISVNKTAPKDSGKARFETRILGNQAEVLIMCRC